MNKKLKKYRIVSYRDDFPITGRHIHSLRVRAFATAGMSRFTEKENAHFDACRVCRLKVLDALKNLTPVGVPTMPKAA